MSFPISQIRVARPTNQLNEVLRFYKDGLLLPQIGAFADHDGYTGVMLGMPDASMHLEFTQHINAEPCEAPGKDNLLVFYFNSPEERNSYVARLEALGYPAVEPENPYWKQYGVTIADPDGWRVVLFDRPSFSID